MTLIDYKFDTHKRFHKFGLIARFIKLFCPRIIEKNLVCVFMKSDFKRV